MSNADHLAAQSLSEHRRDLAQIVTDMHFEHHPELEGRYGEEGKKKCFDDAIYHIDYLDQAVRFNSKLLFSNYLDWTKTMLKERGIPERDLIENMGFLKQVIRQKLPESEADILIEYIDDGVESLQTPPSQQQTFLKPDNPLLDEARKYLDLLLAGKRKEAAELIDGLVEDDVPIKDIYEYIFQNTQYEVGVLWQNNKITVAHEHYSTAATQLIMSRLYPKIFSMDKKGHKLLACSVADELHEIGIRMVTDFFEMDGWDTHYLGANMPDNHLIEAVEKHKADILALSVTIPLHIEKAEKIIKKLRDRDEIEGLKILVGGYSFRMVPDLWKKIGADASAHSAKEAIEIANKMIAN